MNSEDFIKGYEQGWRDHEKGIYRPVMNDDEQGYVEFIEENYPNYDEDD